VVSGRGWDAVGQSQKQARVQEYGVEKAKGGIGMAVGIVTAAYNGKDVVQELMDYYCHEEEENDV